jgi:nucleotide-binding universal stress UspA family protein
MNIVIAHDGSPHSEEAIKQLPFLGLGSEVDALVVTVADIWLPPVGAIRSAGLDVAPPVDVGEAAREEARELAEAGAERVRAVMPGWRVSAFSTAGSPAWEIVRRLEEHPADLVVVGSHGRSRLGRLLLGSVSQRIVEEASCSVRVVRPRRSEGPLRLLVGFDGSVDAAAALARVAGGQWPEGTRVEVVAARDPLTLSAFGYFVPSLVEWASEVNEEETTTLERALEVACARLSAVGLPATPHVADGHARDVLLGLSRKLAVDCIFVGARGLRRIERFLIGSVSSSIAARARASVEVVRPSVARVEESGEATGSDKKSSADPTAVSASMV